jgi:GNAT superfamily N-acetyltransferase
VQIRRFLAGRPGEFDRVVEIGRGAFPEEGWDNGVPPELAGGLFKHAFVAEEKFIIKGFIFVSVKEEVAEILKFAVDPNYRSNGIASRMISGLSVGLPMLKIKRIFSDVGEDKEAAHLLLSRLGFRAIGVIKEQGRWEGRDRYRFEKLVTGVKTN